MGSQLQAGADIGRQGQTWAGRGEQGQANARKDNAAACASGYITDSKSGFCRISSVLLINVLLWRGGGGWGTCAHLGPL